MDHDAKLRQGVDVDTLTAVELPGGVVRVRPATATPEQMAGDKEPAYFKGARALREAVYQFKRNAVPLDPTAVAGLAVLAIVDVYDVTMEDAAAMLDDPVGAALLSIARVAMGEDQSARARMRRRALSLMCAGLGSCAMSVSESVELSDWAVNSGLAPKPA